MKRVREYASVNTVIFIESLPSAESKASESLFNDIVERLNQKNAGTEKELNKPIYFKANSKSEFIGLMTTIANSANMNGLLPILHFEIHGSDSKDGIILNSNEKILWNEFFNLLQSINIATNNNLIVCMAVCHGTNVLKEIDPFGRAPFFGLLSSFESISEETIVETFSSFYQILLTEFDLNNATRSFRRIPEGKQYTFYTSYEIFNLIYGIYERHSIDNPDGFNSRVYEMASQLLSDIRIRNSYSFQDILLIVRRILVESKETIRKMMYENFLFKNEQKGRVDLHKLIIDELRKKGLGI